jgi:hypothetical protein
MKNKLFTLSLLVAIAALSSSVAFGQSLAGKRVQGLDHSRFATATVMNPDSALPAGVYTVGQGGSFPTIDSAFSTLNRDGVLGPVTLTLIDTLYEALHGRRFELGPIAGAGPASRVTIRPAVNTGVTIRGDSNAVLYFQNTKYLTLDGRSNPPSSSAGIKVRALYNPAAQWNDCIDAWGDIDHNEFLYLNLKSEDFRTVPPGGGGGVWLLRLGTDAPDSNLIEGNTVSGIWGVGVLGVTTARPRNNIIRGNIFGSAADSLLAWVIQSELCEGTLIERNIVQFVRQKYPDGRGTLRCIGINAHGDLNTVIRNNVVHSMYGSGGAVLHAISGTGEQPSPIGQGLQIYNNMVYNLNSSSTTGQAYMDGILLGANTGALVAYNTVRLEGAGTNPSGAHALHLLWLPISATVRNNILVNHYHQTSGGPSTAVWADGNATLTSDYNDLHVDTSFANSYTAYRNLGHRTLGNWQATGRDSHSVSVMPPFVSPEDLHLTYTMTPVADAATPLAGITEDIDGNVRPQLGHAAPDIGADEFDHPPDAVDEEVGGMPLSYALGQNYPNPFNPTTTIEFRIQNSQLTILKVFDVLGREVATLVNDVKEPGVYTARWDATGVASGVYFYRLTAGEFVQTKRMLLVR